jgi:CRP/FNR family transcriptional regulator
VRGKKAPGKPAEIQYHDKCRCASSKLSGIIHAYRIWNEHSRLQKCVHMLDQDQFQYVLSFLPVLQGADPQIIREFQQSAYLAKIPAGRDVFIEGDPVDSIALLISGAVRVYKIGETGREITLYRFGNGQGCILTANAILNQKTFPAVATVERDAEAVMIPADVFRVWVNKYELWRDFVFDLLSRRLARVMALVDEVVFRRMDARLASFLVSRSEAENPIRITHQEIASELGSSREVISRLLEDLSERGLVRVSRGEIEVADSDGLKFLAPM